MPRLFVAYLTERDRPMTEKIRAAIVELKESPWTAATSDMCQLDDGFDAFVHTAKNKIYEPSIVVTAARHFSTLVPKGLHHSPALVIWLPPQLDFVPHLLPYVTPRVVEHTSTDLRKRDLVLDWTCMGKSFIAKVSPLKRSFDMQVGDGAIPLVFASETRTAVSALLLGDDFLDALSRVGSRCGENYCPEQEYTPEERSAAMKRKWSRATLADDCIFQESRESEVVLRARRAFRPDWIV